MDPDRLEENPRRKNRRRTSSDFKPDEFRTNFDIPTIKLNEFENSPSVLTSKKISPVAEGDLKHWSIVSEGFPPGTTVDELKKYGRRKQPTSMKPQDNLHLEKGSLKSCESEYRRRFRGHESTFCADATEKALANKENSSNDRIFDVSPECEFSCVNHPRKRLVLKRPPNHLEPLKDFRLDYSTEKSSQYVFHTCGERRKLLRRSTTLKTEGDMNGETEFQGEYKSYPKPERARMIRRLTSLKLDGQFEPFTTEQQDNFIAFLLSKRPILEKKSTLLKMEGDFDFTTEKSLNYVAHDLPERPRIRKRSTSLKLNGELEFLPEYRENFVDFHGIRPIVGQRKPSGNLKTGGEMENQTETKIQFVNFENVPVPESAKPENNLHVEGEMEIVPEYKFNYVDFPRERPFSRRPPDRMKSEGNSNQVPVESLEKFPESEKSESPKGSESSKVDQPFDFLPSDRNEIFRDSEKSEKKTFESIDSTGENQKVDGDDNSIAEKSNRFEFSGVENEKSEVRPSSLKVESEFFQIFPESKKSNANFDRFEMAKPIRSYRSNPTSPSKKYGEKKKFESEYVKDTIPETPSRKSTIKVLSEIKKVPEKNLKFDLPPLNSSGEREIEMDSVGKSRRGNALKPIDSHVDSHVGSHVAKKIIGNACLPQAKQYQAFHVLDVKGKLGCVTMGNDILECDPNELNSTYRLEVSNSEKPEFRMGDLKVFPTPEAAAEIREEAEKRARKRGEIYEKIVKSPEIANCLLGENRGTRIAGGSSRKTSGKLLSPPFPVSENFNKRAFLVLADTREVDRQSKESAGREKTDWEIPDWMRSSPTA